MMLHVCEKVGVGMCMEGIEQNPVVYDLMAEMAFRDTPVQTKVINSLLIWRVLASSGCLEG